MKLRHATLAVAAVLVAGCGDDDIPNDAAAGRSIYVLDLSATPTVEPSQMSQGNISAITGLRWSNWGRGKATGRGTYGARDCVPSCAEGGTKPQEVIVTLTSPRNCGERILYTTGTIKRGGDPAEPHYDIADCDGLRALRSNSGP